MGKHPGKFDAAVFLDEMALKISSAPLKPRADLIPLRVETLLDQAASLLDRCMSTREDMFELQTSDFYISIERERSLESVRISRLEAERVAQLKIKQSELERAFQVESRALLEEAQEYSELAVQMREPSNPTAARYVETIGEAAMLGAYKSSTDLQKVAGEAAEIRLAYESVAAKSARPQNANLVRNAVKSALLEDVRVEEFEEEESHALARAEMEERFSAQIDSATKDPDGPLNYDRRVALATRLFELDFEEAYHRLVVASEGLELVYGIGTRPPVAAGHGLGYLDEIVIWLRTIVNQLVAEGHYDRLETISVSCARLSGGRDKLVASLKSGNARIEIDVPLMMGLRTRRIRGMDGFVQCASKDDAIWKVSLENIGLQAKYGIGPALFGSAASRTRGVFTPRNFGEHYYNGDPVGAWNVIADSTSIDGQVSLDDLTDIVVDFTMVAR